MLQELDYNVTCAVLNAADFGVPQLRFRAVILASRLAPIALPVPTHCDPDELTAKKGMAWVTVKQALEDLPPEPSLHETLGGGSLDNYILPPKSVFAKQVRTSDVFPFNHVTRRYQARVIEIIQQMREGETWDEASARVRKRYKALLAKAVENGESETQARRRLTAEGIIQPTFYKRYYWSAYTRLAWNRPALTITANANFLGSGRFTHPELPRGITMREAARLQSFDDAFKFITSDKEKRTTENIGVGMDMIGEAVPPLLAKAIAVHLDEHRS